MFGESLCLFFLFSNSKLSEKKTQLHYCFLPILIKSIVQNWEKKDYDFLRCGVSETLLHKLKHNVLKMN
jgi:hypothetical protein